MENDTKQESQKTKTGIIAQAEWESGRRTAAWDSFWRYMLSELLPQLEAKTEQAENTKPNNK